VTYDNQWKDLCDRLLAIGGTDVVKPMEPDSNITKMLELGAVIQRPVTLRKGNPNDCHVNTLDLMRDGHAAMIVMGYALYYDDLWCQHSFGIGHGGEIIETTLLRRCYWGVGIKTVDPETFEQWRREAVQKSVLFKVVNHLAKREISADVNPMSFDRRPS